VTTRYVADTFNVFALKAGRCAYGVLLMATFWVTEAIPMAVTAVLPVVVFPWLGVMDTPEVCKNYFKVCCVRANFATSLTIIYPLFI